MTDSLIALAQVQAVWYPPNWNKTDKLISLMDDYGYEYIPKNRPEESEEGITWGVDSYIDDYYPWDFNEVVDPDWSDEGELIYNEVIKRLKEHPDLEITSGIVVQQHTKIYKSYLEAAEPLYVRFPIVVRAVFSYDSYSGETDCDYWIIGVPDLYHLEDLIKKEEDNG